MIYSHRIKCPLVNQPWKITILNGKTHHNLPCSIAMLNYQMVSLWIQPSLLQKYLAYDLENSLPSQTVFGSIWVRSLFLYTTKHNIKA